MSASAIESNEEPRQFFQQARSIKTIEVLIFLFLVVPSLVLSLFIVKQSDLPFVVGALATIFRDLALVLLIVYFLWRNGETLAEIGWVRAGLIKEVVLGFVLFFPFYVATALIELGLLKVGLSGPRKSLPSALEATGAAQMVLATIMVVVVAIAEETIFRGYLLLRLRPALGNSVAAAVALSSLVFAVGHGYEGSAGVVTVGIMGALFALIYLWRGSLAAPIVMHFCQDFLGIVLIPLLHAK